VYKHSVFRGLFFLLEFLPLEKDIFFTSAKQEEDGYIQHTYSLFLSATKVSDKG
jgi:hypothetical protein